jgi:hypothetical protein
VADLYGHNARQRAMALIGIAHPDYRHDLLAFAKERHYVLMEQDIPPAGAGVYPQDLETTFTFKSGETILVRPIKPGDDDLWLEFFYSLSEDAVYHRFFQVLKRVPRKEVAHWVVVDYRDRMALVAVARQEEREQIIAVARYEREPATNLAPVRFRRPGSVPGPGPGHIPPPVPHPHRDDERHRRVHCSGDGRQPPYAETLPADGLRHPQPVRRTCLEHQLPL